MDGREDLRRWVRTWKDAGPELEAIRRREIREADNLEVLAISRRGFNHSLRTLPPVHRRHGGDAGVVQKAPAPMNGLFRAARQLQEFCDARGWAFVLHRRAGGTKDGASRD